MEKMGSPRYDGPSGTAAPSNYRTNASRKKMFKTFLLIFVVFTLIAIPFRKAVFSNLAFCGIGLSKLFGSGPAAAKQPNIVFILTDDQDFRLGSMDHMDTLQKRVIGEGVKVENHFGTVALCCPARATLFRGQAAHNTNITHVGGVGGGYRKWLRTGEWKNYLPHWLHEAGYTSAYFGKFMNGINMNNYQIKPEAWDHTEILTGPYIYNFNHVVLSENGERPVYYEGWHQIDVLRLRGLKQLDTLIKAGKPFYLEIAPATPHVALPGARPTVPPRRHMDKFPGLRAPRVPNWNPADEFAVQKAAWVGELPLMNDSVIGMSDLSMRRRVQALQGVDELVEDVVKKLEEEGVLDNTYIIYTTDNGFHLGNHRVPGGKGLPYREDVNLPFAVRGPGIPAGIVSKIPQSHVDIAPTLLEIAGVPEENWPPFFDGRSLLKEWQDPESVAINRAGEGNSASAGVSKEVINVEYWGSAVAPAPPWTRHIFRNSYKSLRIVDTENAYLFNRWCVSNQTELYDTHNDPYELTNLAINPDTETQRLMDRLSGLLLVTKSCGQDSCRRPWEVLRSRCTPEEGDEEASFASLSEAMEGKYDNFFASLPHFGFKDCMNFQSTANEGPYYPPESEELGGRFREPTDGLGELEWWQFNSTDVSAGTRLEVAREAGSMEQRYAGMEELMRARRELTDAEIGWPSRKCVAPDFCGEEWEG